MAKAPVLILFFTRSEPLRQVFEAVRKHKPTKLYLFQDGPRKDRPDDMEKIMRCREVVANSDTAGTGLYENKSQYGSRNYNDSYFREYGR